ncbi:MAG: hypothetical protein Q7J64_06290, partial [Elusimicrobiota bacterium]|nr:hypothetical protein [Elusimicrobiota bacterium]
MSQAAILCTKCGASSTPPLLSLCAKCGGKNARVCGGCGFQNSLAKNYCDKCGQPISETGTVVAPPPPSSIPATVVKHLKDPKKAPPPPAALPQAKKAAEPGAANAFGGAPLPAAGRQNPKRFEDTPSTGDPWAVSAPAAAAPVTSSRAPAPAWAGTLRRVATAGLATLAVLGSLLGVWYRNDYKKPENAVRRAAGQY